MQDGGLKICNWCNITLRASFTKQGKLEQERNSKTAPMGEEISALIYFQCANKNVYINQRNIPSTAQISVVTNKD